MPNDSDHATMLAALNEGFRSAVPHNAALGFEIVEFSVGDGTVTARVPYDARWVGHPDTGVLHGGVVTSLVDATCGASVIVRLQSPMPIATLDLRIDYLRPATPQQPLYTRAECYKITRHVAFVRAVAYQSDLGDPVATSMSTFMLHTRGRAVGRQGRT